MELRDQLQATLGAAYTLERELGGGGMARVFVATETPLGRRIAVKVLPADAAGGVSIERFKREILLAARLQHPHIVPLLTAGETNGLPFYTMPFVSGDSLRARLARGGELSVNEAIHVMRDVASALAYAHELGVVHRDIKPENIMLSGGVAVVTDFGVAKAVAASRLHDPEAGGVLHHEPTALTDLGVALGTPAYMSPEQATADSQVDHRADLYSLGCVAYEMLAGTSPFAGRTNQQMLAAQVTATPEPILARRPTVPPALASLIMKCLEKRAGDRPQSANEVLAALDSIATPQRGSSAVPPRPGLGGRMAAVIALSAVIVAAVGVLVFVWRPPTLTIGRTTQATSAAGMELDAAISPDGRLLAYAVGHFGRMRIYVKQVGGERAFPLTDDSHVDQRWPRWSPDGSQIAFHTPGGIFLAPSLGGAARLLVGGTAQYAAWSHDGKQIAYADTAGIWVRAAEGGAGRRVATSGVSPAWSPDDTRLAFADGGVSNFGFLHNGNLGPSALWVVDADGGGAMRIAADSNLNASPVWMPDGRSILYVSNREGSREIYQQRLSGGRRPEGAPIRLTTGANAHSLTLSADGRHLAYSALVIRSNPWSAPIRASGETPVSAATPILNENQSVEGVSVSRDGQWLIYDSNKSGNQDIYKLSLAGGQPVQLTTDPGDDFLGVMSPDGREVAFYSIRSGNRDVYLMSSDGRDVRQLTNDPAEEMHPDWSPDGRQILFTSDATGTPQLAVLARTANDGWSAPRQVTNLPGGANSARWIGTQVAWRANGAVLALPLDGGRPRRLIEAVGGDYAVLTLAAGPDPSVVYYLARSRSGELSFWSLPTAGGAPRLLLRLNDPSRTTRRVEFATDGRRLFFTVASDEADVWLLDLKR